MTDLLASDREALHVQWAEHDSITKVNRNPRGAKQTQACEITRCAVVGGGSDG